MLHISAETMSAEKQCDQNYRDSYVRISLLSQSLMPKFHKISQYKLLHIAQKVDKREIQDHFRLV